MSVYNKTPYIVSVLSSLTQELQNALQVLIDTKSEPKLYSLINDDYKITTSDKGVKFIQLECNDKVITGYLVYNNTYCVIFGFNASQKVEIYNVDYANRKIEKVEEECSILEFRAVLEHLSLAASAGLKREIVETLPEEDIDPNVIYMVLDEEATGDNVYNEYLYIGDAWELIGNTGVVETGNTIAWANIDLTSGTASKTPSEAEWLLMTDDETDCKLVLTLTTNEVVRLERVSLTSSTVLFSAVASDTRYTATFTESDNVLSGVIVAKDTSVVANPTIPAGATVNALNALKIGSDYFNNDKPIHFIKLESTTLTEALRSEILSDDYVVVLEYNNYYYYEKQKTISNNVITQKEFETVISKTTSGTQMYSPKIIYSHNKILVLYDNYVITAIGYTDNLIDAANDNCINNWKINSKTSSSTNATAGQVLTADGSGATAWGNVSQLGYLTTAPSADNTSGVLQIVVLSSEPATKYNGYLYIITGA